MQKIQFVISEPCHEKWETMKTADKGKFCSKCAKTILDLNNYNSINLYKMIQNNPGSICGKINASKLDKEIILSSHENKWLKNFSLVSLISLSHFTISAQVKETNTTTASKSLAVRNIKTQDFFTIEFSFPTELDSACTIYLSNLDHPSLNRILSSSQVHLIKIPDSLLSTNLNFNFRTEFFDTQYLSINLSDSITHHTVEFSNIKQTELESVEIRTYSEHFTMGIVAYRESLKWYQVFKKMKRYFRQHRR
jgi:hypothetical protein